MDQIGHADDVTIAADSVSCVEAAAANGLIVPAKSVINLQLASQLE